MAGGQNEAPDMARLLAGRGRQRDLQTILGRLDSDHFGFVLDWQCQGPAHPVQVFDPERRRHQGDGFPVGIAELGPMPGFVG